MTDLSSTLDGILQKHNARLLQHRRSIADITDEFLKDAYQIQSHISALHSYLKSIRAPYLSASNSNPNQRASSKRHQASHARNASSVSTIGTQFLTTPQRDAIDSESKSTLRDLSSAISRLAATESQRREIRRQIAAQRAAKRFPMGALGRWAAGEEAVRQQATLTPEEQKEEDREKTTDAWREAVLWYLRKKLGDVAEAQRDMMERRVKRELEKSMSVLYKVKGSGVGAGGVGGVADIMSADGRKDAANVALAEDGQGTAVGGGGGSGGSAAAAKPEDHGLTAEQLQLFAEENNAMLKHYEDSLDQVRAAEKSMLEISELQTTLAQNLAVQAERIDVLVEDSQRTEENVSGGNRELKQAMQRWRPARAMFWATCGLSGVLVLWDLVI